MTGGVRARASSAAVICLASAASSSSSCDAAHAAQHALLVQALSPPKRPPSTFEDPRVVGARVPYTSILRRSPTVRRQKTNEGTLFHIESRPVGTTDLLKRHELPSNRQVENVLRHGQEVPTGPAGYSDRRDARRVPIVPPSHTRGGGSSASCIYRPPNEPHDPEPGLKESRRLYALALQ